MLIKITSGATPSAGLELGGDGTTGTGTPILADRIYYFQATAFTVETNNAGEVVAVREVGGAQVLSATGVAKIEYGNLTDGGYFRSILTS